MVKKRISYAALKCPKEKQLILAGRRQEPLRRAFKAKYLTSESSNQFIQTYLIPWTSVDDSVVGTYRIVSPSNNKLVCFYHENDSARF